MPKCWYNMTPAKAEGGAAEILLYDIIGAWGISAKQFASDLKALGGGTITLRINSPGGDVMDGTAVFNLLKADGRPITVHIDGMAASMASVIAMAGHKVVMPANALMMVHNPWTVSVGNAEQLRKDADLLDKVAGQIVGAYAGKCGDKTKRDDIVVLMDAETWMDGKEAVAAGFADECGEPLKAAACACDLTGIATKIDARLAAIMPPAPPAPKDSTDELPPTLATVNSPTPVAVAPSASPDVIEARIESERAKAFQDGKASRQAEIDALAGERDTIKAELETARANVAQLTATVSAEKAARLSAETAHAALMGGVKYVPDGSESGWKALVAKHGYEQARKLHPEVYEAYMSTMPGWKQRKK